MRRRMLCSLFALLSLLAAAAWADSQARIVRLSYIEGDVQLDRRDGHGFNQAFLNMPVIEGARLWTRNDGRVEVEFEDGSTARLAPDTIVEFQQLRLRNDARLTQMDIQEGEAYFNIDKHRDDDVSITTGKQSVRLQKSSHFRLGVNKNELTVAVFKGEVELLKHNGERVQVRKNETLALSFTDTDRYYLAKGITEDAEDSWDQEREQAVNTYASRQNNSGYSSAYSYDLNQYGSYVNVNNYGSVWRPYGVGFGWSPFQDGSWVFYPGQGYVWVSPYRWGWTPYHYGSWVNIAGYGWCWRPTTNWSAWAPVPVIVNPPANFVPPPPAPGVGIVHVGRGGNIDVGRGRVRREGPGASGGIQPATSSVSSTASGNSNTGAAIGNTRDARDGRDGVVVNRITSDGSVGSATPARTPEVDLDRSPRGRISRTPQVNTPPASTAVSVTPATVPSVAPAQVPATPAQTPMMSRGERGGRGDNAVQNPVRNTSDSERPAGTTYTPPPQSAPAPARTYTPPPQSAPSMAPRVSAPAPAAAPSAGGHESRGSHSPK